MHQSGSFSTAIEAGINLLRLVVFLKAEIADQQKSILLESGQTAKSQAGTFTSPDFFLSSFFFFLHRWQLSVTLPKQLLHNLSSIK